MNVWRTAQNAGLFSGMRRAVARRRRPCRSRGPCGSGTRPRTGARSGLSPRATSRTVRVTGPHAIPSGVPTTRQPCGANQSSGVPWTTDRRRSLVDPEVVPVDEEDEVRQAEAAGRVERLVGGAGRQAALALDDEDLDLLGAGHLEGERLAGRERHAVAGRPRVGLEEQRLAGHLGVAGQAAATAEASAGPPRSAPSGRRRGRRSGRRRRARGAPGAPSLRTASVAYTSGTVWPADSTNRSPNRATVAGCPSASRPTGASRGGGGPSSATRRDDPTGGS